MSTVPKTNWNLSGTDFFGLISEALTLSNVTTRGKHEADNVMANGMRVIWLASLHTDMHVACFHSPTNNLTKCLANWYFFVGVDKQLCLSWVNWAV
jgi:hypothetical protein